MIFPRPLAAVLAAVGFCFAALATEPSSPLDWPAPSAEARPRAYWWWMGSAVDTNNLARELARYRSAGLGGVHIIPIYGARGWESNYISYLCPRWMEMLDFTV
ncbi:MAG: glycosyl hydrolase, partial [Limisphaerales bacterium]